MSTAKQLPLSMPPREALGPADFARSPANDEAVAMLSDPARWPVGRLALVAPAGAGKSHLVNMLLMTSGAALRVEGASIADADIDALAAADPVIVEGAEAVAGDPAR
ncbi:MAG: chromosomal replication initiator DnaA, partial [Pseudomonadota bacterium]